MKAIIVKIESADDVNITAEAIENKWNFNLIEENKITVRPVPVSGVPSEEEKKLIFENEFPHTQHMNPSDDTFWNLGFGSAIEAILPSLAALTAENELIKEDANRHFTELLKLHEENKALSEERDRMKTAIIKIEQLCDNQNSSHEDIWRIANTILST